MKRLTLLLVFLLMTVGIATAQTTVGKVVSGTVVSSEDGKPIVGATIRSSLVKSKGTVTDIKGHFRLIVPDQEKLVIVSYIGMKTQNVKTGTNVRVVLHPASTGLDEIVVVGYGTAKKQSLVGAQTSVSAKQLQARPLTNVSNALAGSAPGVQVTLNSGQPGEGGKVRIRGFGSMNASSDPLYIVDGAPFSGAISSLSPQDIKSITILKDAAATAIYGSSAANGVVLITTKSGSGAISGAPKITFSTSQGASSRGAKFYDRINAMQVYPLYWQMFYNANKFDPENRGLSEDQLSLKANADLYNQLKYQPYKGIKTYITVNPADNSLTTTKQVTPYPLFVTKEGKLNPEINGLLWGDDLDWEKELFRVGYRQEYNLSATYNNDKVNSYLSTSYMHEDGYRIKTSFQRFTARTNLTYKVNKWLRIGSNSYLYRVHTESPKILGAYASNSFQFISYIAPIYPIHRHNLDGSYILSDGHRLYDYANPKYAPIRPYSDNYNPILESQIDRSFADRDGLSQKNFVDINLSKDLKFTTNLSYDVIRKDEKTRYNNQMGDQPQGVLDATSHRYTTIVFNQLLNYNKTFGQHELGLLLGHESYSYQVSYANYNKENTVFSGVDEMNNYSKVGNIFSYTSDYRKEGYFGRLNYTYDSRYNLSASYRRDGSSRFAANKRWGNFWSFGAGWHIDKEAFMSNVEGVNTLKLRGSIGQTGNDALQRFDADGKPYQDYFPSQTTYDIIQNGKYAALRMNSLGNPNLLWETQTSYDLALDFGFFRTLSGSIEFFDKESKDLLFDFPLPASTGIGSISKNLGKVRNYGLEFNLKLNLLNTRDLRWDLSFNGTMLKNKIVTLPEENRKDGIITGNFKYLEGHSIYDYYLPEWIGVDPDDGIAMYRIDSELYPDQANPKNPNFAGVKKEGEAATWTKEYNFAKKHYAGSAIPTLYGGFGTSLSYKNFDFNMLFSYQVGGVGYDTGYQGLMGRSLNVGRAKHVDMLKAWRKKGQKTDVPRLDSGQAGSYDNSTSDRFLISSNGLMLKSVSLSYDLPKSFVSKLQVSNMRISLMGENLFLLSKRKGYNPFDSYSGDSAGTDYSYAKTLSTTISVTF